MEPRESVRLLSDGWVAEIDDFDAATLDDEDIRRALRRALADALILVVRGQSLSVEDQVRLTRVFGRPEIAWDVFTRHPENEYVQIVTNAGRPPGSSKTSSQFWHTDRSFVERPSAITLLHSIQIAAEGGDTLFANMRRGLSSLPESLQIEIHDLQARHSFAYTFLQLRADRYSDEKVADERDSFPDVLHPLVRTHPITGERALFLNQLCVASVEGLPEERSSELLKTLYSGALTEDNLYGHRWQVGDVLIWDNASLMHRGTPTGGLGIRRLHRTTIQGNVPI